MSPSIDLFSVHLRVSISRPRVDLICQSIDVEGEKVLWVDGLTMDSPVLLPIAAVAECIQYRGTFREFLMNDMREASQILAISNGEHSPTIIARAVQLMSRDRKLSAEEALHLVVEEALDIMDADQGDAEVFYRQYDASPLSLSAGATA